MEKNYTVELYRFIFTFFVVMFHLASSTLLTTDIFGSGGHSVDFFFILSGYLMYQAFIKTWSKDKDPLGYTINFIRKRVVRFAPIYYICFIVGALYHLYLYTVCEGRISVEIWNYLKGLIPELFFLNGVWYNQDSANGATWYISILLISTAVIIWILCVIKKRFENDWIVLLILAVVGCYYFYGITLFSNPTFSIRLARGIGDISVGCLAYLIVNKIKDKNISGFLRVILNFTEIVVIFLIFYFMFIYDDIVVCGRPLLFLYTMLIALTFLQKTIISRLLNKKIFNFGGKISYAVYLSHLQVLLKFGWQPGFDVLRNRFYSYVIIIGSVLLWGIVIYFLPNIIRRTLNWLNGFVHADNTLQYIFKK